MTSRHHRRAQLRAAFAAFLVSATLPSIAHGQEMMAEQFIGKFTVFGVEGRAALADENGAILYTYEKDPPFVSVCTDRCAQEWPPATAIDADTDFQEFTIISRPDGLRQWTFNGRPLYRSRIDPGPGETKAIGTDGLWYVVRVLAHFM